MHDYLDVLVGSSLRTIEEGYYETSAKAVAPSVSLKEAILKCKRAPVISEVKFASLSMGTLRRKFSLKKIVKDMEEGGAVGISVLTEPRHFNGNLDFIAEIRDQVSIPILMKDIFLSPIQVDAAYGIGANAVLLIQALFDRGYCEKNVQSMIDYIHLKGLEVLLEVHTEEQFFSALKTSADLIGINNRDLKTLEVDLEVTKFLMKKFPVIEGKVIVSESGIKGSEDICLLREYGAQAFLVGTAIMKASDVKGKVKELVMAL